MYCMYIIFCFFPYFFVMPSFSSFSSHSFFFPVLKTRTAMTRSLFFFPLSFAFFPSVNSVLSYRKLVLGTFAFESLDFHRGQTDARQNLTAPNTSVIKNLKAIASYRYTFRYPLTQHFLFSKTSPLRAISTRNKPILRRKREKVGVFARDRSCLAGSTTSYTEGLFRTQKKLFHPWFKQRYPSGPSHKFFVALSGPINFPSGK